MTFNGKSHSKRSIILINLRILINIIDYVIRQGQYIDTGEAAIKILTLASIISNDFDIDFDIIEPNYQYSERLT